MLSEKQIIILEYLLSEYFDEGQYVIQENRVLLRSRSIQFSLIEKISKSVYSNFDVKAQIPNSPTYKDGYYNMILFIM